MQHRFTNSKKAFERLLGLCFLVCSAILLSQCKGDKKQGQTVWPGSGSDTMYLNTLVLDSNAMNYWVSQGWTSGPKKITVLLLQFFSSKAGRLNDSMRLIGYPAKNMSSIGVRPPVYLSIDTSTVRVPVVNTIIMANNIGDVAAWDLFNPNGTRKYDLVRLKPALNAGNYVYYQVELVKYGMAKVDGSGTNPCPPCQYCNPPNCPEEESL